MAKNSTQNLSQAFGQIPYGIEILLKKAAIDSEFRGLLLENPEHAAKEIDLELDPIELGMLRTIPREQLVTIIDQTEVPPSHRRAFLGTAAAAMLAVILAPQETTAGAPPRFPPGGSRPDIPRSFGIQPDVPPPVVKEQPGLPMSMRVPIFLEDHFRIPRDKWKPTTAIKTSDKTLPKFRQAIYDEFDVRMPAKTLKALVTVKKLTEYLEESLEGYEEKPKKP